MALLEVLHPGHQVRPEELGAPDLLSLGRRRLRLRDELEEESAIAQKQVFGREGSGRFSAAPAEPFEALQREAQER